MAECFAATRFIARELESPRVHPRAVVCERVVLTRRIFAEVALVWFAIVVHKFYVSFEGLYGSRSVPTKPTAKVVANYRNFLVIKV